MQVARDVRRIANYKVGERPTSAAQLADRIFSTVYMGTINSSDATRQRAKCLAEEVGIALGGVSRLCRPDIRIVWCEAEKEG